MEFLITAQTVAAAAEAITSRGGKPSVRKIRDELGGGSPNAILPLLNVWKDGQRQRQAASPETPPGPADVAAPAMPPEIGEAMDGLSSRILATLNTLIERERSQAAAAQQTIQAAANRNGELARVEADQRVAEAANRIEDARTEAQDLAQQLEAKEGEATARAEAASKLEKRVAELEDERRQFQQQAAADRQAADGRDAALHERLEAAEQDRRQHSADHAQERAAAQERELCLRGQIEQAAQRERDALRMAAMAEAEAAGWRNKAEAQAGEITRLSSLRRPNRIPPKS